MALATCSVRFEPDGIEAVVPEGTTLIDAAHAAGIGIPAPCGGVGRCGACRVEAVGALSPLSAEEADVLGGAAIAAGKRLACRARVLGDVVVTLGRRKTTARVVTHGATAPAVPESPAARGVTGEGPLLGAAVDIGTTTIAVAVVDLVSGAVLAHGAGTNPQDRYGADVLSRVAAAMGGDAEDLGRMVSLGTAALVTGALSAAGSPAGALREIVCCGNTAMMGLFLGRDVSPLAAAPYEGADITGADGPAAAFGLSDFPHAALHALPGVSAFLGADVTAGLLATRLDERSAPTLFVDLGTNGEIVLAAEARLTGTSTAAGPALEGASITCGMRAETGAIERVTLMGDALSLGVIDDVAPAGICGSGLLDLVAALLDADVLATDGRLRDDAPGSLGARVAERAGQRVFIVDAAADIVLAQKDIRQVQLAVAAVRTGIDLLLSDAGIAAPDVVEVVMAGGFGLHVDARSLARLGMVPAVWRDRVVFAGNTALAGARRALVSSAERRRARSLAGSVRALDLAAHPGFQARFLAALGFPAP